MHGLGISIYEALTGRLPFPTAAGQAELLQHQLHDPIPSVRELRGEIPTAVDAVIQRATAKHPADRYQTVHELMADFEAAIQPGRAGIPVKPGSATVITAAEFRNPYKGLRAFTEADSGDFHGRERLVDRLLALMSQTGTTGRIAAVVGPSGIGKSSVVRAGLLPALRQGRVPTSERWFVAAMLPGSNPFDELAAALLRVATHAPENLMKLLTDDRRGVARVVKALVPEGGGSDVLLVIDQFEELFTLTPQADTVRFLDALEHAVTDTRCPLRVVLTMRADFWDRPLRHGAFARLIDGSTVNVTALAPDELERAIVAPAQHFGAEFEPGLVSEIVADVNDQPGALPLLQYALTELWERQIAGVLTRDAYRELGGVTGALARRAEELYVESTPAEQQAARRLFGRLVTLGEGTEDVRRRAARSEVGDDVATASVIERFGKARLLSFDHDPSTREPTIEVAHEALIREWPRLREWLDADRDGLRVHRHLTDTAAAWVANDRDPGELYRGARLETAEMLLGTDTLNPAETEFLRTSLERRDSEAANERARLRRLRRLVTATAVIAVLALLAGAIALVQWRRADDQAADAAANAEQATESEALAVANAERAATNEALAEANADEAAANAALADQRAVEAEQARAQADIERLRAVALSTAGQSPTVAALLAVESNRIAPSIDSLDVLHRTMTEIPGYRGSVPGSSYLAGDLLDDGVTLVATGLESVDIWDLQDRTRLRSIAHAGPTDAVIEIIDDQQVAVLGADRNETVVYDLRSGTETGRLGHAGVVNDVSVSADGALLAAAMEGGAVEVWSLSDLEMRWTFDTGDAGANIARWSPTSETLAIVTLRSEVQLWNVETRALLWATEAPGAGVVNQVNPFAAAFNPNGTRFAFVSGSLGSEVRTIDVTDGREALPPVPIPGLRGFPLNKMNWIDDTTVEIPSGGNVMTFSLEPPFERLEVVSQFILRGQSVDYSPVIDQYVVAGLNGLEFWSDDRTGPLERAIPLPPDQLVALAAGGGPILASFAADGNRLLVSTFVVPTPPNATSFDLTKDPPVATTLGPLLTVGVGEFTFAAADFTWQILDADLVALGPPVPLPFDFSELGVSEDGRFVAIGRLGGFADVYRASGEPLGTVQLGVAATFAGAQTGPWFTSDGEYMVLATTDGRSGLWATDTLERLELPDELENSWMYAIGPWLFTPAGESGFQRLDPATLEPVGGPVALNGLGALGYPKVDPTNTFLAATGQEVVKVFDLASGRQLGRDLPYVGQSNRIEFSADGGELIVPNGGRITIWNFDTDSWPEIACETAGRNLTPRGVGRIRTPHDRVPSDVPAVPDRDLTARSDQTVIRPAPAPDELHQVGTYTPREQAFSLRSSCDVRAA